MKEEGEIVLNSEEGELNHTTEEGEVTPELEKITKNTTKEEADSNQSLGHKIYFKCKHCDSIFFVGIGSMTGYQPFIKHMRENHKICFICEAEYKNKHDFKRHTDGHKVNGVHYVCSIDGCLSISQNTPDLFFHRGLVHNQMWLQCDGCDIKIITRSQLIKHDEHFHAFIKKKSTIDDLKLKEKRHDDEQIENCYALSLPLITDKMTRNTNRKENRKLGKKLTSHLKFYYRCKFCDFAQNISKCLAMKRFRNHLKVKHFICFICNEKSVDIYEVDKHIESHMIGIDKFVCNANECTQKNMGLTEIFTHVRSIHNNEWCTCDECPRKFMQLHELETHKQGHMIKKKREENRKKKIEVKKLEPKQKIICNVCGLQIQHIVHHMILQHKTPKISCSYCNFTTIHASTLKVHENAHRGERFQCQQCNFSCSTSTYLKSHVRRTHQGLLFKCPKCDYNAPTLSNLDWHKEKHNGLTLNCLKCNFVARGRQHLRKHSKTHEDPKYFCDKCDYKTYDAGNFKVHNTVKHGNEYLKCNQCKYDTKSNRSYKKHMLKHNNTVESKCLIDAGNHQEQTNNKYYFEVDVKTDHINYEKNEECLENKNCHPDVTLESIQNIKQIDNTHVITNHTKSDTQIEEISKNCFLENKTMMPKEISTETESTNQGATLQEDERDMSSEIKKDVEDISENIRNRHIKHEKQVEDEDIQSTNQIQTTKLECDICYFIPTSIKTPLDKKDTNEHELMRNYLRSHMIKFHFICKICEQKFENNFQLDDHWESQHSKYWLRCKMCKYDTKSLSCQRHLRVHMKKVHFSCVICEILFENSQELNTHFKLTHKTSDNRVICHINGCLQTNQTVMHLYNHLNSVHKGVWYNCDQCNIRFNNESNLKRHKNVKHIKIPPKKIKCSLCDIEVQKRSLLNHMQNIHGENPTLFCSKCQFSTKDSKYLQLHEEGHLEKLHCQKCVFSCITPAYMKRHLKFKHEGAEMLKCPTCSFKSQMLSNLKYHIETHNDRSLQCDLCEFKAITGYRLKKHSAKHQDPKYGCTQCDYKTYDSGNFSVHLTVKHGNEILKCDKCEYATKSRRSLRKHRENKNH